MTAFGDVKLHLQGGEKAKNKESLNSKHIIGPDFEVVANQARSPCPYLSDWLRRAKIHIPRQLQDRPPITRRGPEPAVCVEIIVASYLGTESEYSRKRVHSSHVATDNPFALNRTRNRRARFLATRSPGSCTLIFSLHLQSYSTILTVYQLVPMTFIAYGEKDVAESASTADMKLSATEVFSSAAAESGPGCFEGQPVFGNRHGLQLMDTLEALKTEVKNLNERVTSKDSQVAKQIAKLERENALFRNRTENANYRQIRHRFLEAFRRDSRLEYDQGHIRSGNQAAHHGDVTADTELYNVPGGRTDPDTMEQIYGVTPDKVDLLLGQTHCEDIIALLNKHATLVVKSKQEGKADIPEPLKLAFKRFITKLKKDLVDQREALDPASPTFNAYNEYYQKFNRLGFK
ncbi:hypothetical protein FQN54_008269 [Arachnomyces sp. PD_36]|nr:hypothetical protein FQN54_008269 [Arachnomyces sp. PD_36]